MTPADSPTSGTLDAVWLHRHRNGLTALLLMVLAWVFYFPTTGYDFVYYDDVRILKNHPELYGQAGLGPDLKAIFVTQFPREEPLLVRDVNWAVDSRLFGFGNPFGYHLDNVLLHGCVVALLFVFLLGATGRYRFALATAAAYLVLAVHVEPVAWIMGRKDILSALFMLLALCAQTRRLAAAKFPAQSVWFVITLFCFAAALLSKISVLTFPVVLWLHAVLSPYLRGERPSDERFRWDRALWRETILVIPSLLFSGAIYVWYQRQLAQMGIFDRGYNVHGLAHLWNLLLVNPLGFWLYLRQIFLPFHLAVDYPWHNIKPAYPAWQIITSLATVVGAAAAGLWLFCRRKDLFFYYAVFFVLMIPYLNIIYIGILVADRYVYFSVFCVLAIALSVATTVWQRSTQNLRLVILAVGLLLAADNCYQAASYEPAWRNGETLWAYHIVAPGHKASAYDNLAAYCYAQFSDALARQDKMAAEAALHKMQVVVDAGLAEFCPDPQKTPPPETYFLFFLRSLIEQVTGQPEAALQSLLMADRLRPGFDSTNLNLSRLYSELAYAASNRQQKADYLHAARDRFAEYVKLVYRNRTPPAAVQKEIADLDAACAAVSQAEIP